jgi:ATP-binding cassette subfamily C (CFTR/MRP) protein 1
MTSIERIIEYTNLNGEDVNCSTAKAPVEWPQAGEIVFDDVSFTYAGNLPDALKNMTFKINASEKVGVVGRTGSGKSSIFQALFRMAESTGSIRIDGVDIKTLSLHQLRNKISVIPVSVDAR